jgi:4-amino-4-deoxy-L-arabinose transferase-like glycosyltransferase
MCASARISVSESHSVESAGRPPADPHDLIERHVKERFPGRCRGRWGFCTVAVFAAALVALVPTVGDFGLTWDEPAYRYGQVMSAQWWEQLSQIRSRGDLEQVFDPLTLLYYWPYGRHGINFHPPLAGQLNLATHAIFGHWLKDIPARRMATVIEFALTIALGFHFLAGRDGGWVGLVMAGSLLLMPRLYGQAHLIDTDTPGLLLWSATALAVWKGLHETGARHWRVVVGILVGLAFIEKMGAVMVLVPLLIWLTAGYLPRSFRGWRARFDWLDGIVTTGAMLAPLALAFQQIQIMQQRLPPPGSTDFFLRSVESDWPGAILAIPVLVWFARRLLGRLFPNNKVWGVERPALETGTATLAFAPVIGWLGNPAWWRETFPRLAHYYTISVGRRDVLPDIQNIYFGQIYEYGLPWHNAWVLMGITVPVAILATGAIGLLWALAQVRRDRLPFYFVIHLLTFPVLRMFSTPAHDGVRLFLPTFFFLAAFAGWGTVWLADLLARPFRLPVQFTRIALTAGVLGSAALALVRIHPYELSYYNEVIGGPRGAWRRGFELTYWFDAFNNKVLADLNRLLPHHAEVDFLNDKAKPVIFHYQQGLGALRSDIILTTRHDDEFPFVWLQTQDSKSSDFTRLLFAMRPWYASQPSQLAGARVVSVPDPVAVSRAWALRALLVASDLSGGYPPAAPQWVQEHVPSLARFWGDGLDRASRLALNQDVLNWSRTDPKRLLAAARHVAAHRPLKESADAQRLVDLMTSEADTSASSPKIRRQMVSLLLKIRPAALVEAVQILNAHRDEVVRVMTRYAYTDVDANGGYLDRDIHMKERQP